MVSDIVSHSPKEHNSVTLVFQDDPPGCSFPASTVTVSRTEYPLISHVSSFTAHALKTANVCGCMNHRNRWRRLAIPVSLVTHIVEGMFNMAALACNYSEHRLSHR